jgi:hypothetical protein
MEQIIKCVRCKGEADYVIDGFSMCDNCSKIYIKKKAEKEIEI